ncbi:MAG: hypothetical protein IPH33_18135 [Bacteroidetes bacterium]|nr:hypothetical protein [Bacteroidota bacterium]
MKNILLVFLICISFKSKAQQIDSTQIKLDEFKKAVLYMSDNLQDAHERFQIGTVCMALGTAAIGVGVLLQLDTESGKTNDGATITIITGGVLSVAGAIIMIDSHKFIGKAGNWHFTGDKFTLYF